MRNILTYAKPEWREQRSTSARVLDPKNQDKMKTRGEVVHTNWYNLMKHGVVWVFKMVRTLQRWEKFREDG